MTQREFEDKLADIKAQETAHDVEIQIHQIIDKDHLDCVWYGGDVGTIKCKDGYTIVIGAYGDIRLVGEIDGEQINIIDKSNGGRVYRDLGQIIGDKEFHDLIDGKSERGWLMFENNNWFEVDLIAPNRDFIDLFDICDNVLDDDLLNCFMDIDTYLGYIDEIKNR